MKQTRMLVNLLVTCGVALMMVTSVAAQTVNQGKATVVRIKGAARFSTGNSVFQPLKVGDVLSPGAVVQTAADSFVDIVLDKEVVGTAVDTASSAGGQAGAAYKAELYHPATGSMLYQPAAEQNVVRVLDDSVLAIDKLTFVETGADVVTDTQLDLRRGSIFGTAKKLSAASHYEVKIPNGVAGIRGTVFMISAQGVVAVLVGSVVISWVGSDGAVHTEVVPAGDQYDLRTGQLTTVSPLSAGEMGRMVRDARVGPTTHATTITDDHTIYLVSPTKGHS